jgi:hypothetical protein
MLQVSVTKNKKCSSDKTSDNSLNYKKLICIHYTEVVKI